MGHWPSGAPGTACCTARTTSRVAAVTGGLSSCAPAHEHLDLGADGASPMRHPLLGRERRFGEADAEIMAQEQGDVTDRASAAGRREGAAFARRLGGLRLC